VFAGLQPAGSRFRRHRAVGLSVGAHLAVLAATVFHNPRVIDLSPTRLAYGDSAHTYRLIYVPQGSDDTPPETSKLPFPRLNKPRPSKQPKRLEPAPKPEQIAVDADAAERKSRAGSPLGTMIDGPITGHEVHVAYPTIYPDPPVDRSELPRDLVGDVVIEVTIDSAGNVVDTKIVQAIGHGIDEKIESTLRRWHYQPATLDGTPVASRHDVHFHFPS